MSSTTNDQRNAINRNIKILLHVKKAYPQEKLQTQLNQIFHNLPPSAFLLKVNH